MYLIAIIFPQTPFKSYRSTAPLKSIMFFSSNEFRYIFSYPRKGNSRKQLQRVDPVNTMLISIPTGTKHQI